MFILDARSYIPRKVERFNDIRIVIVTMSELREDYPQAIRLLTNLEYEATRIMPVRNPNVELTIPIFCFKALSQINSLANDWHHETAISIVQIIESNAKYLLKLGEDYRVRFERRRDGEDDSTLREMVDKFFGKDDGKKFLIERLNKWAIDNALYEPRS